jgi:predicted MFS family arabinose efflux permease
MLGPFSPLSSESTAIASGSRSEGARAEQRCHALLVPEGLRERLSEPFQAFRAVFANPGLRRIQLAAAGSETGKWLYILALSIFAYDAGGATAVGIIALIRTVPAAIGAPFTALLGDRYRRDHVMLGASLARVVAVGATAAVAASGASSLLVYLLAGVVTLTSTAFRPAQAAALPSLARTPDELTAANVASSTISTLSSFLGPAAGGLLFAVTSTEVVFLTTAGVFLWSALLVSRVKLEKPSSASTSREGIADGAIAGFRTILGDANLRVLMSLYTVQAFVGGAFSVFVVVVALDLLDLGHSGVGLLNAGFGVGGFLGAAVSLVLLARRRLAADFMLGIVLWGVPLVLIGLWPNLGAALVLLGLVGVGETLVEVAGPTMLQRSVPDALLARVFGALESLLVTMIGLGGLTAPLVIHFLGVRGGLVASGLLLPAFAALFWRRLLAIDREHAPPERELDLLRGVSFFTRLPEPTLEQLASRLERIRLPAGRDVFRQGDSGDRFYVVAEGEVEVLIDGRSTGTLGPGEYFGEIALLRDIPRTAGVRARSDVELYSLARDDFIAAVTGHAPSLDAADAVIAVRLGSL